MRAQVIHTLRYRYSAPVQLWGITGCVSSRAAMVSSGF